MRLQTLFFAALLCLAAAPVLASDPIVRSAPRAIGLAAVTVVNRGGEAGPLDAVVPPGPLILHVWATWCPSCRQEIPALERFRQTLSPDRAERLVIVSVDRLDFDRLDTFLRDELELPGFRTWKVTDGNAGTAFRLFGYPDTILLDAEHREIGRHVGALDWDDATVRGALLRHVAGE